MEKRLLRAIMNPAMAATWLFGLMLAATPGLIAWGQDVWIWVKLGGGRLADLVPPLAGAAPQGLLGRPQHRQRPALPADERGADAWR